MDDWWYCLVKDNDGHSYVIDSFNRDKWYEFLEIPSDDERSWAVPAWAERVENIEFTGWRSV